MERGELLTTGQAARLLGSSRQHVVDLCERGALPCSTVGRHRRICRSDVEAFAAAEPRQPTLTRDQLQSLWLHRAVAGRLASEPTAVLEKARRNLDRLLAVHAGEASLRTLGVWRATLDAGPEAVMTALCSDSPTAVELRQSSPFAGLLPDAERLAILRSVRDLTTVS